MKVNHSSMYNAEIDKWSIDKWKESLVFIKDNPDILDIGCSNCVFFLFLKQNNIKFNGYGFDIDKRALKKIDYKIYHSLYKINKKFDIITMWDVIEHLNLEEFLDYLNHTKKILKKRKKSLLMISTPNIMNIFYPFWSQPTHIRPYSLDSLTRLLKSRGFEIIKKKKTHKLVNPIKLIFCRLMNIDPYSKIFVVAKLSS